MDNDQFYKTLLRSFLPEVMNLMFPHWDDRFEFGQAEWLQQELFPNAPKGELQRIDLLVKIPVAAGQPVRPRDPTDSLVFIHFEVEGRDSLDTFDTRMWEYQKALIQLGYERVLPLVIFTHVQAQGRGVREIELGLWEEVTTRFRYNYLALRGLDAAQYQHSANMLGVAWSCLMNMPAHQRPLAAADAMQAIVASPLKESQKYLLVDFVQSYSELSDQQMIDLNSLLRDPKREQAMTFTKTVFERQRDELERVLSEKLRTKLREELTPAIREELTPAIREELTPAIREELTPAIHSKTLTSAITRIVLVRFPMTDPNALQTKLANLTPEQLDDLLERAVTAASLQELGLSD